MELFEYSFEYSMSLDYDFDNYTRMSQVQFLFQSSENQLKFCKERLDLPVASKLGYYKKEDRLKILFVLNKLNGDYAVLETAYLKCTDSISKMENRLSVIDLMLPGYKTKIEQLKLEKADLNWEIIKEIELSMLYK